MPTPVRRVFLGWRGSAIELVAERLWDWYVKDATCDLTRVVLVVPGARTGRKLLEHFADRAEQQQLSYFPPRVTTAGQLPELLYRCQQPFASDLTQQLAWAEALRQTEPAVLQQFLRELPGDNDPRWSELAAALMRQHLELAADGLNFAAVARAGAQLPGFGERARWQALARVQQAYLARLDRLQLWDRQTARLYAIEHQQCQTDADLILIGTVDLNRALRQMLDQVASRVTALVYADESWQSAFDEYGCLIADAWAEVQPGLGEDQYCTADRPADQAAEVVRFLSDLAGQFSADEITLGVPNESLAPLIEAQLARAGVPARYGPGTSAEATRPMRLLRALTKYLATDRLADLADALRHPDLRSWWRAHPEHHDADIWALDDYCEQRLIVTAHDALRIKDGASVGVRRLIEQLSALLAPLAGPPRLPANWAPQVMAVLAAVYSIGEAEEDDRVEQSLVVGCQTLHDGLLELQRVPDELAQPVSATTAILMALATQRGATVPAPPEPGAIELLGWLELPLDGAPALVVTQFNDGTIPSAVVSDLFLPDSLRTHLGLNDNARRYARDAYALTTLVQTRQRLKVIVGRHDEQGNPLLPSRLLFATDEVQLAGRCQRLFAAADSAAEAAPIDRAGQHGFVIPYPTPAPRLTSLSVTDFQAYLACPYRFYLGRVLKLKSVVAGGEELDGAMFGTLLHEVLASFGAAAIKGSDDPGEIEAFLHDELQTLAARKFGPRPRPAVLLQLAQARLRLSAMADRQSEQRRQGWEILRSEHPDETLSRDWLVDDESLTLRGRIDRIDRHEVTGQLWIWDYKSSDTMCCPRSLHHGGSKRSGLAAKNWQDLQLPLYRHLASQLAGEAEVGLGIISLCKDLDAIGFQPANWSAAELAVADNVAHEVVRSIRAQRFWPPNENAEGFDDGFNRICQVGVFDHPHKLAEGDEQAAAAGPTAQERRE